MAVHSTQGMTDSETAGRALNDLATPFLYVDVDRMSSNIDAMAAAARRLGVRLRPHAKTHKVPEIARLQIAAGATGITVSKISEAEVFADAGIDDLFVPYQIVAPPQLERLVRLARSVRLRCAARRKRPGGDRDPTGSVPIRVRQRHSPRRHAGG